jgi:RHS repeat-associated protein
LPASLLRTRTALTTRRRWRKRVSVRRRASGRVHYNYFRDYDPAIGGYIESDPIGLRDGVNTYGYVHGDPVMESDRRGLGRATGVQPARSRGALAVSLRCGSLFMFGVHCEVVVTCKKTGETIGFGIGGAGDGLRGRLSGGEAPTPYRDPRSPTPDDNITQYAVQCRDGTCDGCKAMECFRQKSLSTIPLPYYGLWQNSNTYAQRLMGECGCHLTGMGAGPSGSFGWNGRMW